MCSAKRPPKQPPPPPPVQTPTLRTAGESSQDQSSRGPGTAGRRTAPVRNNRTFVDAASLLIGRDREQGSTFARNRGRRPGAHAGLQIGG